MFPQEHPPASSLPLHREPSRRAACGTFLAYWLVGFAGGGLPRLNEESLLLAHERFADHHAIFAGPAKIWEFESEGDPRQLTHRIVERNCPVAD